MSQDTPVAIGMVVVLLIGFATVLIGHWCHVELGWVAFNERRKGKS